MVVVKALLTRIVNALPCNNALGEDPGGDVIFVQSCDTLAKIAQTNLELVLGQLMTQLQQIQQSGINNVASSALPARILASEVLLLRLIVRCCLRNILPSATDERAPLDRYATQVDDLARALATSGQTLIISQDTATSLLDIAIILLSMDEDRPDSATSSKSWTPDKSQRSEPERQQALVRGDTVAHRQEQRELISVLVTIASSSQGEVALDRFNALLPLVESQHGVVESLAILAYMAFDSRQISLVLSSIARSLPEYSRTTRVNLVIYAHTAICNWITNRPREFSKLYQLRASVSPGAETLFGLAFDLADTPKRKELLWPVLATFLMLSPDSILTAMTNRVSRKAQFLESIRKTHDRNSKLLPAAIASWTNILHALDNVRPEHRQFLSGFSNDRIANILQRKQAITESVEQGTFTQPARLLSALYRMKNEHAALEIIAEWLSSDQASRLTIAAIATITELAQSDNLMPMGHQALLFRIPTLFISCTEIFTSEFGTTTAKVTRKSEDQLWFDRELCLAILRFLRQFPTMVCLYTTPEDLPESAVAALGCFLYSNDAEIVTVAAALLNNLLSKDCLQRLVTILGPEEAVHRWGKLALTTLLWMSKMLTGRRQQTEDTRRLLALLKTCLDSRYEALEYIKAHLGQSQDVAEFRAIQISLKLMVFVLLCNYDLDVQMQAAKATLWVLREKGLYKTIVPEVEAAGPNNEAMFRELARNQFVTSGRNAVQRVIKRTLRTAQVTPATKHVWGVTVDRFNRLGDLVIAPETPFAHEARHPGSQDSNNRLEWLTLLGITLSLTHSLHKTQDVTPSVAEFVDMLPRFLFASDPIIREMVVECVGADCPFSVVPTLTMMLYAQYKLRLGSSGQLVVSDDTNRFVDSYFSIMRAIFDRLSNNVIFSDEAHQMKLGCQMYAWSLQRSLESLKLRLRASQCLTAFANKEALINIENRQQALTQQLYLVATHLFDYANATKTRQEAKVISDIEAGSWRVLLTLFSHLPLHSGADGSKAETTLEWFITFFTDCLRRISRTDPQHESVCSVLRTILTANVRSGLAKFMTMTYDSDPNIRATFFSIVADCTDVIIYDHSNDPVSALSELILREPNLTIAMCEACPTAQLDAFSELLLEVYRAAGREADLAYLMIDHEIQATDSEGDLFRRNCTMTKIYSIFAKRHGAAYLQETLKGPLDFITQQGDNTSYELDPAKIGLQGREAELALARNAENFSQAIQVFVDGNCKTANRLPAGLRGIARHVARQSALKYPSSEYTAVGAFIILRFISPAIIAPLGGHADLSSEAKRKLILICKVIQNLANNVFFKETYMDTANEFLKEHIRSVTKFLHVISRSSQTADTIGDRVPLSYTSQIDLHQYLYGNTYRVREGLMKLRHVPGRSDRNEDDLRNLLTTFQTILARAGVPAKPLKMTSLSDKFGDLASGSDAMHAFECLHKAKILYFAGQSRAGNPVLCYIPRRVRVVAFDQSLWTLYLLSVLEPYWSAPFEIFVDLTGNTRETSTLDDDKWLPSLMGTAPPKIFNHLATMYWLNCAPSYKLHLSQTLMPILKRVPTNFIFLSAGDQLNEYFSLSQMSLPPNASLDASHFAKFEPGFVLGASIPIEASFRVAPSIQALFVVEAKTDCGDFMASSVSFFPFSDIEDVKVKAGSGAFEFRTRSDHKLHTFASPGATVMASMMAADHGPRFDVDDDRMSAFDAPSILFCAGVVNVASIDQGTRLAASQLINKIGRLCFDIPMPSYISEQTATNTPSLRDVANASMIIISKVVDVELPSLMLNFLRECLLRLPSCDPNQQAYMFMTIQTWITVLIQKKGLLQNVDALGTISRALVCFLQIACETTVLRSLVLHAWRFLADAPELSTTVYETLLKFAQAYEHDARQVSIVSDIIRSLRSERIKGECIQTLFDMIVERLTLVPGSAEEIEADKRLLVQLHLACGASHMLSPMDDSTACLASLFISGIRNDIMQRYNHEMLTNTGLSAINAVLQRDGDFNGIHSADEFYGQTTMNDLMSEDDTLKLTSWAGFQKDVGRIERLLANLKAGARYMAGSAEASMEMQKLYYSICYDFAFSGEPFQMRYRLLVGMGREGAAVADPPVRDLLTIICSTKEGDEGILDTAACLYTLHATLATHESSLVGLAIAAILVEQPLISAQGSKLLARSAELASGDDFMTKALGHPLDKLENELGVNLTDYSSYGLTCILQDAWSRNTNEEVIKECLAALMLKGRKRASGGSPLLGSFALPAMAFLLTLDKTADEMRTRFMAMGLPEDLLRDTPDDAVPLLLFTHAETKDNTQALLLLSLLMLLLRGASHARQILIYRMLSEAVLRLPEVSALFYAALAEPLQTILISSQNIKLLEVVQQLITAQLSMGITGDTANPKVREQLLEDLKFPYLGKRLATGARLGSKNLGWSHLSLAAENAIRHHDDKLTKA